MTSLGLIPGYTRSRSCISYFFVAMNIFSQPPSIFTLLMKISSIGLTLLTKMSSLLRRNNFFRIDTRSNLVFLLNHVQFCGCYHKPVLIVFVQVVYACVLVSGCVYLCACVYVCMCACVCECLLVCVSMCECIYVCVYALSLCEFLTQNFELSQNPKLENQNSFDFFSSLSLSFCLEIDNKKYT